MEFRNLTKIILCLLLVNIVHGSFVKDLSIKSTLTKDNVIFNLDGELIGNNYETTILTIFHEGYFNDYNCKIATNTCIVKPIILENNTGTRMIFPKNTPGFFSSQISLKDSVTKSENKTALIINQDKKDEYKTATPIVLNFGLETTLKYFSIEIPTGYLINNKSTICHYSTTCTKYDCTCFSLIRIKNSNIYKLNTTNSVDTPYLNSFIVEGNEKISINIYFEKSEEFITIYTIIAILTPFFIVIFSIIFFILTSYLDNKKLKFLLMWVSPEGITLSIYLLLRGSYLNLTFLPFNVQDIYFLIVFAIISLLAYYYDKKILITNVIKTKKNKKLKRRNKKLK